MDGSSLVLESDGTVIDSDEVLKLCHSQTIILMQKNEKWRKAGLIAIPESSSCSTVTLDNSFESLKDLSDEETRISESFWQTDFQLPWDKFSASSLNECENGNKKNRQAVNDVVHVMVNAVREVKTYVPSKVFKIIAKKIVEKYPLMFQDVDEEKVILGDGAHTIFSKLQDRNNYLNRPHKRYSQYIWPNISPKQRKLMIASKAGKINVLSA